MQELGSVCVAVSKNYNNDPKLTNSFMNLVNKSNTFTLVLNVLMAIIQYLKNSWLPSFALIDNDTFKAQVRRLAV